MQAAVVVGTVVDRVGKLGSRVVPSRTDDTERNKHTSPFCEPSSYLAASVAARRGVAVPDLELFEITIVLRVYICAYASDSKAGSRGKSAPYFRSVEYTSESI
ncbi:unnamed protein product [Angiostrongylus costaricensis]|uniref:Secreted protein n=1 Tax=Angiostrongylus costaricensis TaxID=334426 RepID=A0A0R3PH17_ANGCS|nr:unnamed protein product [Angiostrongylus costaricensis]